MNKIILVGRSVKDVELRYTPNGKPVAGGTIAVDRPGKQKETDFVDLVFWDKTAEIAAEYCVKGKLIAVEGRLQIRKYDDKDGNKRTATEVVVGSLELLGGKNGESEGSGRQQQSRPQQSRQPQQQAVPAGAGGYEDDDIPF